MPAATSPRRPFLLRAATALAAVATLALLSAGPAHAASGHEIIEGEAATGESPDSSTGFVVVSAREDGGVAEGSLTTYGRLTDGYEGWFAVFHGSVRCMATVGDRTVVSAFGTAQEERSVPGTAVPITGSYEQIVTVERGSFRYPWREDEPVFPFRYADLGAHDEGVSSAVPRDCGEIAELAATGPEPEVFPTYADSLKLSEEAPTSSGSEEAPPVSEEPASPTPPVPEEPAPPTPPVSEGHAPRPSGGTDPAPFQEERAPVAQPMSEPVATVSNAAPVLEPARLELHASFTGGIVELSFGRTKRSPGETFRCRVDRRPSAPCGSPARLRLKPGRHRIVVTSSAPAGQPAVLAQSITVTVRRHRGP
jgi:hypothetical protein